MKERLEQLRAASLVHLRTAGAWLSTHRSWVEVGVLTTLALLAAYAVGSSSLAAAERYDRESDRLIAVASGMDRWAAGFQPVTPGESTAWLESEHAIRTIDTEGADPTTMARLVAARAEEAGIGNLSMRLVPAAEISAPPPIEVGRWSVATGSAGISVEFLGDWPAVIGFFGSLPVQVEVGSVNISPGPERLLRTRVILLARQVSTG